MKQVPKKLRNRYRRVHTAITIAITIVYMALALSSNEELVWLGLTAVLLTILSLVKKAFDHYEQMQFECVKYND